MIGPITECKRGHINQNFYFNDKLIITTHRKLMHLKVNGEVKNHLETFLKKLL